MHGDRGILIHCNMGLSRSPSLALLWLAKRAKAIRGETYSTALLDYVVKDPAYTPSLGVATYLATNWAAIG